MMQFFLRHPEPAEGPMKKHRPFDYAQGDGCDTKRVTAEAIIQGDR